MSEIPVEVNLQSQHTSDSSLMGVVIVTAGRMLSLISALFLVNAAIATGPTLFGAVQPLAVAAVLLFATFSKRSTASLLAIAYVVVFISFLYLRTLADQTGNPAQFGYPIFLEHVLFLGTLPSVWLQNAFYMPGRVGPVDLIVSSVYVSYFVAPHLAAIVVWRTRPERFTRTITAISLTFILGLALYFAIPTAPPWLASSNGDIDSNVHRVLPEISAELAGDTYDQTAAAVGNNDVAAMPSLHTALTTMVALILAAYGKRWRWVGIGYVAMMGFALVYMGEHYVVDELAGIALAVGVWKLVWTSKAFAWLSRERTEPQPVTVAVEQPSRRAA
jgi:membrane-associated phospholipid phosphatase